MNKKELLFKLISTGIGDNNEQTETFISNFDKSVCNFIHKSGKSLLEKAFGSRKYDIAKFLIEQECNLNYQDKNGFSILIYFVSSYDKDNKDLYRELIYLLIEKKVKVDLIDKYGNDALWYAHGNAQIPLDILELLLKNGGNPHLKNNVNKSTYDCVLKENFEDLKLLFEPYI